MPTYAYACQQCDHRFDAVQSMAEDSLEVCPECSGPLRKVFGSVSVTFKGSGFYRTDSRQGASGKGSSSTSKVPPAPTTKPAAASSKPASSSGKPSGQNSGPSSTAS